MKAIIYTKDFNRIIAATKDFVDNHYYCVNPMLRFIRLEFSANDSTVTAVAVDGRKLSIEHAPCNVDEDFIAYINTDIRLPLEFINTEIEVSGDKVMIRCGEFIFSYPQRKGEFIDWKKALPDGEPVLQIGVNGDYLMSALKAAMESGNCKNLNRPVLLDFYGSDKPIILRINKDKDNNIKMVLPVKIYDAHSKRSE